MQDHTSCRDTVGALPPRQLFSAIISFFVSSTYRCETAMKDQTPFVASALGPDEMVEVARTRTQYFPW